MDNPEEYSLKAGKWGTYQLYISLIVIFNSFSMPMILLVLPMMQKEPSFYYGSNVHITNLNTTQERKEFCDNVYYANPLDQLNSLVVMDRENSIINWAYQLKLVCNTREVLALIGTVFFLGSIATNLSLSKYPDRYGRRKIYLIFNVLSMLVTVQLTYLNHLGQLIISSFIMGLASLNQAVGSVYLSETIDEKYSGLVMGISNAMFPVGGMINTLIIYFVKDWNYYLYFVILTTIFTNIATLLYMKESPKWLYANQFHKEYFETIYFIATLNGNQKLIESEYKQYMGTLQQQRRKSSITVSVEKESSEEYRKHVYNVIDLFKYKSIRMMTFKNLYLWSMTGFTFFGLLLNLEGLTGDIFVDALVTYTAETIAEVGSGFASHKYGRRNTALVSFILGTIGAFLFNFVTLYNWLSILFLFVSAIGVASGFNILYIYSAELYPTNIKSLSISYFSLFNRLAGCIIPFLLTFTRNINLFISILSLGAVLVVLTMPESLGYNAGDEVEELRERMYEKQEVADENDNYLYFHDVFETSF